MSRLAAKLTKTIQRAIGGSGGMSEAALDAVPDGFTVNQVGDTGIRVIDNFCTEAEAASVIAAAQSRVGRSTIVDADGKNQVSDVRSSSTAGLFSANYQDPSVIPLMRRAGALVGLPYTHLENVFVTRYRAGDFYEQHI